jgi:hypothetical protein
MFWVSDFVKKRKNFVTKRFSKWGGSIPRQKKKNFEKKKKKNFL